MKQHSFYSSPIDGFGVIENKTEVEGTYVQFENVHGEWIIMFENLVGDIRWAYYKNNIGITYDVAWANKATLEYKTISKEFAYLAR